MHQLIRWVKNLHEFASKHLLYPISLSTLLVLMYFTGRVYLTQKLGYQFLIWNLFLAWLPYLFSLVVSAIYMVRPRWWWATIFPSALWLLFLPNAFYIVTDFIHLTIEIRVCGVLLTDQNENSSIGNCRCIRYFRRS